MGSAGLGAGAGKAFAAEGLDADDGADLVAVDIDVADPGALGDLADAAVDAAVDAQRQAVARGIQPIDQLGELRGLEGHDVQHRAEDLPRSAARRLSSR